MLDNFWQLFPGKTPACSLHPSPHDTSLTAHGGVPSLHITKLGEALFASTGLVFSILLHLSTVLRLPWKLGAPHFGSVLFRGTEVLSFRQMLMIHLLVLGTHTFLVV